MALMGRFPLLNGPFFNLNGPFPRFRPGGAVLRLENPLENSPLRKGALRGPFFLRDFLAILAPSTRTIAIVRFWCAKRRLQRHRLKPPKNGLRDIFHCRGRSKIIGGSFFYLQFELLCLQLRSFACSPLRPLLDALSHCEQESSDCISKEAKAVSKTAPSVSKKAKRGLLHVRCS